MCEIVFPELKSISTRVVGGGKREAVINIKTPAYSLKKHSPSVLVFKIFILYCSLGFFSPLFANVLPPSGLTYTLFYFSFLGAPSRAVVFQVERAELDTSFYKVFLYKYSANVNKKMSCQHVPAAITISSVTMFVH